MTSYTTTELAAERSICKRLRAKVYADPCGHCLHREMVFDKAICPTYGRSFPKCTSTPGLQFDIDHETLKGPTA